MQVRVNSNMQGPGILDGDRGRYVFMDTSFTAELEDGLRVTGRLSADPAAGTLGFERAAERLRGVGYTVVERMQLMEPGRHDEAIIQAVEGRKADLLVMGAYGHSRLRNMLVGSTTTALLRGSTVPVLVVRG